jgi:hypothetical protein
MQLRQQPVAAWQRVTVKSALLSDLLLLFWMFFLVPFNPFLHVAIPCRISFVNRRRNLDVIHIFHRTSDVRLLRAAGSVNLRNGRAGLGRAWTTTAGLCDHSTN